MKPLEIEPFRPERPFLDADGGAVSSREGLVLIEAPAAERTAVVPQRLRRGLDIVLSVVILALLSVPMLLIAAAIKLSSRGPVFYRQNRYGLHGRIFAIWKFRTLSVCERDNEVTQVQPNDTRVTWIGRFLRKTCLDELPNFFNVLLGDMSIVGPRPHPVAMDDAFAGTVEGYRQRNLVKPGVTGLAQICGSRGGCFTVDSMGNRLSLDLYYTQHATLGLDLQIILQTALMIVTGRDRAPTELIPVPEQEFEQEMLH